MHIHKLLGAISIAVAVYSLLSLAWGATGFSAYQQLLAEKERLDKHEKELIKTNNYLKKTRDSYRQDPEALALDARRLGYGKTGEKYIRIEGLGVPQNPHAEAGNVSSATVPESVPDLTIKIIAIFAGISFFVLALINDIQRSKNPFRNAV